MPENIRDARKYKDIPGNILDMPKIIRICQKIDHSMHQRRGSSMPDSESRLVEGRELGTSAIAGLDLY